MKKAILFIYLFIGLSSIAFSQNELNFPIDSVTKLITYTDVIDQKESKEELYNKALEWFARAFKSSNDVIQVKDKDAGKIIGKWSIKIPNSVGPVSSTITLLVKDNKYKYIITDLYFTGGGAFKPWALEENPKTFAVNMIQKGITTIKKTAKSDIENLIIDLKKFMAAESQSKF